MFNQEYIEFIDVLQFNSAKVATGESSKGVKFCTNSEELQVMLVSLTPTHRRVKMVILASKPLRDVSNVIPN